jgi:sarcosine oxidase subunit gamma
LSCLAPGRYLATADRLADLPSRFARSLSSLAAITDQSDLWHTLTLTGPAAALVLARLVPINLAPEIFPVGALALTRAGHLDVRLWHIADATYELATPRSYAADLDHALHKQP